MFPASVALPRPALQAKGLGGWEQMQINRAVAKEWFLLFLSVHSNLSKTLRLWKLPPSLQATVDRSLPFSTPHTRAVTTFLSVSPSPFFFLWTPTLVAPRASRDNPPAAGELQARGAGSEARATARPGGGSGRAGTTPLSPAPPRPLRALVCF